MNGGCEELQLDLLGVVDDQPSHVHLTALARQGYSYLGPVQNLPSAHGDAMFVVGIGKPSVREIIAGRLMDFGMSSIALVHPKSVVGSASVIGAGSVVCGGVQISTNVTLGAHVHLNPAAVIGHDVKIANFVSVNPGAVISGDVEIDKGALIGAGAVVLQGLHIGVGAVVGAGAVVVRDVAPGSIVKGVPAR
ncbi:NeuD/PglB/VioB family sugar acetyltransferase [Pseudarthrobacter sp. alpha12b]